MEVSDIVAFKSTVLWINVRLSKHFSGFSLQPIPGWANQTPRGQPRGAVPVPGPSVPPAVRDRPRTASRK